MTHAASVDDERLGDALVALVRELYPICRSITGDGVRETLRVLSRQFPIAVREVPSGTQVLDWTVPNEWNIRDAWIADDRGRRLVDFRASNLHVVSYSVPVRARMSLDALRPHLHSLPDQPDLIPYRTSYYAENWGFCMTHQQLESLTPGDYDVRIDSTLAPGSLTYGEIVLPGSSEDEILISSHVCHPSLCDDNLTGLAVSILLAREMESRKSRRYTMRFLYAPGTIGAITWLALNEERVRRVRHGLTLTCLGDAHPFTYKRTVGGREDIDRAAALVLAARGDANQVVDYFPYGYDERQYNSPGFRVPVGSLMRGRHGQFPEYHTSGDNLDFISGNQIAESWRVCRDIIDVLEGNAVYSNLAPRGEPQLGRRGLYRSVGGTNAAEREMAMFWMLGLSDGKTSLLDIAERSKLNFEVIRNTTDILIAHGLLAESPRT